MSSHDICWMSAVELAKAIKRKRLSPVEVVRAILERIEAVNPRVNAYVTVTADSALAAAKRAEKAVMKGEKLGSLHGVPVSIKDMIFTQGVRTTFGCKLLEDFVPEEDAVCVSRLKEAGAIVLGKTNMSEFGFKPLTDNMIFGITRNPWNLEKTPGGSSGGAAAAVACGLGPLAVGADGGGSIRIPSSCCGVFGIKPQLGRVPRYPAVSGGEMITHEGPITRTVGDAALMLDVMGGYHWGDSYSFPSPRRSFARALKGGVKGMKIAWSPDLGYAAVEEEVIATALNDDNVDCATIVLYGGVMSPTQFTVEMFDRLKQRLSKPVTIWVYGTSLSLLEEMSRQLEERSLPTYTDLETAVKALGALVQYAEFRRGLNLT